MNEDIEVFLDSPQSGSYIESLARTRQYLKDTVVLASKLDEAILMELELAILGAEKAKSEILKASKDNVRPLK